MEVRIKVGYVKLEPKLSSIIPMFRELPYIGGHPQSSIFSILCWHPWLGHHTKKIQALDSPKIDML
jgi:hypothetical protein